MSKLTKLTIIDFNSLENDTSSAECIREEKYFHDSDVLSSFSVCGRYISSLTITPYLAWSGDVYPKFKISSVLVERSADE